MPLTTFAWMLHTNDEATDALHWDVSVNWVMPWGKSDATIAWPEQDAPAVLDGQGVADQCGGLLFPWTHTLSAWHAVAIDANNDCTIVPAAATALSVVMDRLGIQRKLEEEIVAKAGHCTAPFSLDAAYLPEPGGTPASLPHLFAPLTHLPAPIAGGTLGMTRWFRCNAALRASAGAFVPEFSVEIGGTRFSLAPRTATLGGGAVVTVVYAFEDAATGAAGPFAFQVITKKLTVAGAGLEQSAASCEIGGAERADLPAREALVTRALSALDLLDASLLRIDAHYARHPDPALAVASAVQVLGAALGTGGLREERGTGPDGQPTARRVGVWERLAGGSDRHTAEIAAAYAQAPLPDTLVSDLLKGARGVKSRFPDLWNALAQLDSAYGLPPPTGVENSWPAASYGASRGRAIIGAAAAALRSPHARFLLAAWLAALALAYSKDANASPFWRSGGDFGAWYARLAAAIDEHTAAGLMCGSDLRGQAAAWPVHVGPIGYPEARALRDALSLHAFALGNTADSVNSEAVRSILRWDARRRVFDLRRALAMNDPEASLDIQLGEDRELSVTVNFDSATARSVPVNQEIRGYAVAMAAGYQHPSADLDWQWLTDVAARVWNGAAWESLDANGKPMRLHDTVGATRMGGYDVISFEYSGMPMNGRLNTIEGGEVDPDGVDALDFVWPEHAEWRTPKLAYGLTYWALATPLGNAGRVMLEDLRDGGDNRKLRSLDAALFEGKHANFTRYTCRVAPGSPVIALADRDRRSHAYELADDSRTRVYLAQTTDPDKRREEHRIALIRPEQGGWIRGLSAIRLSVRGPDGTPNVVDRWLEADRARHLVRPADGKPADGDPDAGALDNASKVEAQQVIYRNILKPLKAPPTVPQPPTDPDDTDDDVALERRRVRPRHPAVRAFGVEVQLHHPAGTQAGAPRRHVMKPETDPAKGYIKHGYIEVVAGDASGSALSNTGSVVVTLAPGAFARVTVWSLAPEKFFSETDGIGRMADFPGKGRWSADGKDYRSFASASHWVECLPKPLAKEAREAANKLLFTKVEARLATARSGRKLQARVMAGQGQPLDATWLKGFLVQRHEWHWTGYPIAFPRVLGSGPTLFDWAEPFMGTQSLRESRVDEIQSVVGGAAPWHFAGAADEVIDTTELPSEHGAKFIAHVLRPVRRFDRWLPRWTEFDGAVLGAGLLANARLRWDDPTLRLAPPDIKAAVPLVKTFGAGAEGLETSANGCMLCLGDVLYRTDPLARFGGVGEILEVDLEETRFNEVYEIGPNPTMHAAPRDQVVRLPTPAPAPAPPPGVDPEPRPLPIRIDGIDLPYASVYARDGTEAASDAGAVRRMDWRLRAGRPFGLGYDLDRNPKVAQTAIVVHPEGTDISTYWVMAKVRLRRLLDPDRRWTEPWPIAADPKDGGWLLGRRAEGEDWIPHDFCIEPGAGEWNGRLVFARGPVIDLQHPRPPALKSRYLCTWHKGHWNNTDQAFWGLQLRFQQLFEEGGQWETTGRVSPYETQQGASMVDAKDPQPVRIVLEECTRGCDLQLNRLLASDYSAAHWLTFIGLPFRDMALANETYWLAPGKKGAWELRRSNRITGNIATRKNGEPVSRDLLLNPVAAEDFALPPNSYGREGAERNSFHLLLLFKRVNDVTAPGVGLPLGQLVNAYKPVRDAMSDENPYPPVRFVPFMASGTLQPTPDVLDCVAYIYRFQAPHGQVMPVIGNWQELQARMFPAKDAQSGEGQEAGVRWTPEFFGPISLADSAKWPAHVAKPAPAKGTRIRIRPAAAALPANRNASLELTVNPGIGWRIDARRHADGLVPDDVESGTCSVDRAPIALQAGKLELYAPGGRLVARIHAWGKDTTQLAAGDAWLFDDRGQRVAGAFEWTPIA